MKGVVTADEKSDRQRLRQRIRARFGPVLPMEMFRGKQLPLIPGEPITMEVYDKEAVPKSFGNPWYGAYSKHGFWYKFHVGVEDDFNRTVAWTIDTDEWTMVYDDYKRWKAAFGDDFSLVAVKDQKDEYIGTIGFVKLGDNMGFIGVYWVMEDWRHSGIGIQLFNYAMKKLKGRNVGIYGVNYLWDKIRDRQHFTKVADWSVGHIIVENPQGLNNLKGIQGVDVVALDDSRLDMSRLVQFDTGVAGFSRGEQWVQSWLTHANGKSRVALSTRGDVIGYGMVREVAGGDPIKWLVVGPLYANDARVAQALIYELLHCYADETEHPEWDPNYESIEYRTIHFFLPSYNETSLDLCSKLKGDTGGVLTAKPFYYRLQFTKELPNIDVSKVFCITDWQMAVI